MTDIWFHRFYDNFKIGEDRSAPLYVYEFAHIASNDRIRIAGNQKIIQNGKLRHEWDRILSRWWYRSEFDVNLRSMKNFLNEVNILGRWELNELLLEVPHWIRNAPQLTGFCCHEFKYPNLLPFLYLWFNFNLSSRCIVGSFQCTFRLTKSLCQLEVKCEWYSFFCFIVKCYWVNFDVNFRSKINSSQWIFWVTMEENFWSILNQLQKPLLNVIADIVITDILWSNRNFSSCI